MLTTTRMMSETVAALVRNGAVATVAFMPAHTNRTPSGTPAPPGEARLVSKNSGWCILLLQLEPGKSGRLEIGIQAAGFHHVSKRLSRAAQPQGAQAQVVTCGRG